MTSQELDFVSLLVAMFKAAPAQVATGFIGIFGVHRTIELVGDDLPYTKVGERLIGFAQSLLELKPGELRRCSIVYSTCEQCGTTGAYVSRPVDLPSKCSACGGLEFLSVDCYCDEDHHLCADDWIEVPRKSCTPAGKHEQSAHR